MPPADSWGPDQILKALALIGAAVAFIAGLLQYRRAQQWKRAEWVAQEMKALFSNPLNQAVVLMIDWGSRSIPLYPDREDAAQRFVWVTDDDVAKALMAHEDRPQGFSALEADIRAAFDRWLDELERFNAYEQTGLVARDDLKPYLKYWADKICRASTPGPEDRLIQLRAYMHRYGFTGAHSLLRRLADDGDRHQLPGAP